jgi:hypothetical protein
MRQQPRTDAPGITMTRHVQILAWLHLTLGVLGLLGALAAFGFLTGFGLLSGDPAIFGTMWLVGSIAGVYFLVVALPSILVGIGLLGNWGGWVIILAVILGFLNLANAPFGTALAIYTFWVAYKLSAASESFG